VKDVIISGYLEMTRIQRFVPNVSHHIGIYQESHPLNKLDTACKHGKQKIEDIGSNMNEIKTNNVSWNFGDLEFKGLFSSKIVNNNTSNTAPIFDFLNLAKPELTSPIIYTDEIMEETIQTSSFANLSANLAQISLSSYDNSQSKILDSLTTFSNETNANFNNVHEEIAKIVKELREIKKPKKRIQKQLVEHKKKKLNRQLTKRNSNNGKLNTMNKKLNRLWKYKKDLEHLNKTNINEARNISHD